MSLLQHTTTPAALEFDEDGIIFSALSAKEVPLPDRIVQSPSQDTARYYISEVARILDKPRTGWTIESRNIAPAYRETIGAHLVKVALSVWYAVEGLVEWHKRRGEEAPKDLVRLYTQTHLRLHLARKGFFHDYSEWGEHRDYRPGEISKPEKVKRETGALEEYKSITSDGYPLEMFLATKTQDFENTILENADKIDPAIMALNYQRELQGAEVAEFFDSAFDKLTLPLFRETLEILIEHRDQYPIDMFSQFLTLLRSGGDIDAWRGAMEGIPQSQY